MNFYENPGNTAARRCNGAERSKWRDHGVDPELLSAPEVFEPMEPTTLGRVALERSFNPPVTDADEAWKQTT